MQFKFEQLAWQNYGSTILYLQFKLTEHHFSYSGSHKTNWQNFILMI